MTNETKPEPGTAEITYVGDYSGLTVYEINRKVERGVPFRAPIAWCAKQLALRPAQWKCDDPAVAEAAAPLIKEEAAKMAAFAASSAPPMTE